MLITPRYYQIEAVRSLYSYFQSNRGNPVLALPTGTGKSVVIAMFLQSVYSQYSNQRIMVLTHVKELIEQNYNKLKALWSNAPCGIYSAGLGRRDTRALITFAGIASIAKKASEFGHQDLIIIDEAHLVSPTETTMYQTFLAEMRVFNPNIKVIGLTATPWRLGHGKITDSVKKNGELVPSIFTDICYDVTGLEAFNKLIAEGFISPVVPKATSTILDVNGVRMVGGEFSASELQHAVDKQEITVAAIKESIELGYNRGHWLVFTSGVEHAEHTSEILNLMEISSTTVHSKMNAKERDQRILDFKSGKYRAVVNNNVLTTGFDFPAIDMIVVLRPTASAVLWVQMLGRGTRPFPQKENCLVLDFAANTKRLGPINDPVIPRKKGDKGGTAPVKLCPCCNTYNHASVRICNGFFANMEKCSHEFVFQTKLQETASTNDLIKGDLPQVEIFKVDHITYSLHRKEGKPPSIKVSYYCGLRMFDEFVCIEHGQWAGGEAAKWWRQRTTALPYHAQPLAGTNTPQASATQHAQAHASPPVPVTTIQALSLVETLQTATHLRIWINKKYPEIMAACLDGSAFGTIAAPSEFRPGSNVVPFEKPLDPIPTVNKQVIVTYADFDDDIPF